MDTTDLMQDLSGRMESTQSEIERLLDASTRKMVEILDRDVNLTLPGLGTFFTHVRKERRSYDPYHDRYLMIPPKRVLQFHPSAPMKDELKTRKV